KFVRWLVETIDPRRSANIAWRPPSASQLVELSTKPRQRPKAMPKSRRASLFFEPCGDRLGTGQGRKMPRWPAGTGC
ncbi:MAG TPA: hypothetical protein VFE24_11070, partial [Pirellulales bacterium]|nr:hypothetical protein [Pirellulales bacterium]